MADFLWGFLQGVALMLGLIALGGTLVLRWYRKSDTDLPGPTVSLRGTKWFVIGFYAVVAVEIIALGLVIGVPGLGPSVQGGTQGVLMFQWFVLLQMLGLIPLWAAIATRWAEDS